MIKGYSNQVGGGIDFRFFYSGGKFFKMDYRYHDDNGPWRAYIKVIYDAGRRNVKQIKAFEGDPQQITINYDYSNQLVKGQYYPDEKFGDFLFFWALVKELNFFPELQSQNLLLHSLRTNDFPTPLESTYTNHVVDGTGKLISYTATIIAFGQTSINNWNLNWSCFNNH